MSEDLFLAVKKGAYLLDEKYPKWHESIDLDILDLGRADLCILGQLGREHSRSYETELDFLGIKAEEYGFSLDMESVELPTEPEDWAKRPSQWEILTDLWINQIRLRQLAP